MSRILFPIFLVCVTGITSAQTKTYENLNALLWSQRSAEYRSISLQTFQAARIALEESLKHTNSTAAIEQAEIPFSHLPPALILDLDETVLDNTSFRVEMLKSGDTYSEPLWQKWVEKEQALSMPGAVEFLTFAQSQGVTPFYITSRVCNANSDKDFTVAVLKKLNFPFTASRLLCRLDVNESTNKASRRARVASTHRIALMFGDDLNDFVSVPSIPGDWQAKVELRYAIVEAYRDRWGKKWFMLPNPMYGSWERAIGETVELKVNALRP